MNKAVKTFYKWYFSLPVEKRGILHFDENRKEYITPRVLCLELNAAKEKEKDAKREIERLMKLAYEIMSKQ